MLKILKSSAIFNQIKTALRQMSKLFDIFSKFVVGIPKLRRVLNTVNRQECQNHWKT